MTDSCNFKQYKQNEKLISSVQEQKKLLDKTPCFCMWELLPLPFPHETLSLVALSHYGYTQGFPINAAGVSKCHFTKVWGTSHCFPLQFTVGGNTTQDPGQDFEIKLEDAVNRVHRNSKGKDLIQTMWVTVGLKFSPCYWWKEIMTAVALSQLHCPKGWGSEAEPTPFSLTLCLWVQPVSIPREIQMDSSYSWSEFSWFIFMRSPSSVLSFRGI